MLRRRHFAQEKTAGKAEEGQETPQDDRQRRSPAGSVYGSAAPGRGGIAVALLLKSPLIALCLQEGYPCSKARRSYCARCDRKMSPGNTSLTRMRRYTGWIVVIRGSLLYRRPRPTLSRSPNLMRRGR